MWSIILLVIIGIVVAYDVYCYLQDKDTLSQKVRDWTVKYPLTPFLLGFIIGLLAGHWYWPAGSLPFGF